MRLKIILYCIIFSLLPHNLVGQTKEIEYKIEEQEIILNNNGIYDIYLVYTSGIYSFNIISAEKQEKDAKKYNAEIFKGWLVSNKVKLIVE